MRYIHLVGSLIEGGGGGRGERVSLNSSGNDMMKAHLG